jgi:hypothetical protein
MYEGELMKVIVTTTINPVTEAIRKFEALADWHLVVIGDLKTPKDYNLERGIYVTPEMQEKYDKELSDVIGWNCIQRRSFGLLWAKDMNADVVAVVDDDNIPYDNWGSELMLGRLTEAFYYGTETPAFDPVGATNEGRLWHRGFPLQLLSKRDYSAKQTKCFTADVQADFWNGDPDIDAICRMEHAPECQFDESFFPIASNRMSPFNSQNTFIRGDLLKDYFLFPHIGRMDDIWASYYLQAKGHTVIYGRPSVYQDRNEHDLVKDMKQEYLGYENNLRLVQDLAADPEAILKYLPESSTHAFKLYRRHF